MNQKAAFHNDKGNKQRDRGNQINAIKQYRKAISLAPEWAVPWYNLGLTYKHQSRWQKSLECNQRAVLYDPKDEAAWWNLGIAATAVGNWAEARRAWEGYGITIPDGDGPIEMTMGPTPVRVNPAVTPEVVWCTRIDPARAIIRSVPLPKSERRYGDLILHDGEPKGYRKVGATEVPVFDELAVLEPSGYSTYEVVIEAHDEVDRQALVDLGETLELGVEDWSNVRMLCKACSEGRPHSDHDVQPPGEGPLVRYGFGAHSESAVYALLNDWRKGRSTCLVHEITCVLEA